MNDTMMYIVLKNIQIGQKIQSILFLTVIIALLLACTKHKAANTTNPTFNKKESIQQSTFTPNITINSNGTSGILESTEGTFIYAFPQIEMRSKIKSFGNIVQIKLSNSSTTYAIQTIEDSLEVFHNNKKHSYALPISRNFLRDWTISDDGTQFLSLKYAPTTENEQRDKYNGILEVWTLPFDERPLASLRLPIHNYEFIRANGDLTRILRESVATKGTRTTVFKLNKEQSQFEIIHESDESSAISFPPAIMNEWIWAASLEGILGWNGMEQRAIPGQFSERCVFSPQGKHLLVYLPKRSQESSNIKVFFRLFELPSLKQIKEKQYSVRTDVNTPFNSYFILDKHNFLFEIWIKEGKNIAAKQIEW